MTASTLLFIFAGALALIGHTTAVAGLILALKNRRRRSHYRDREAVELMACGGAIVVLAVLVALMTV